MDAYGFGGGHVIADSARPERKRILILSEPIPTRIQRNVRRFTWLMKPYLSIFKDRSVRCVLCQEGVQVAQTLVVVAVCVGLLQASRIEVNRPNESLLFSFHRSIDETHDDVPVRPIQPTDHQERNF